jgi:N-acetylglucosamine-6-phosphate deacetylase
VSSKKDRRDFFRISGTAIAGTLVGINLSSFSEKVEAAMTQTTAKIRPVEFPGLMDLQVNGFAGVDFNDPGVTEEKMLRALKAIQETGVTRCLPTLTTSSPQDFSSCARTIARMKHAAVMGFHMEGPYISPLDGARGAHPKEFVCLPDLDDFKRRQEAADGKIMLVSLAPEVEGAIPMIEFLVKSGIRVAIAHTAATPAQIQDAVKAGATLSTHLGNGCAQMLPRHPNFIWEQLAEDRLLASFIVDGQHLPPATVKSMIRAKTPARSILVTDAIEAAGLPPGSYQFSHHAVELSPEGRVSLVGTPYLAGSALRMDAAVGNTVRFTGLPLEDVLAMASTHPARYIGVQPAGKVKANWDPERCQLEIRDVKA